MLPGRLVKSKRDAAGIAAVDEAAEARVVDRVVGAAPGRPHAGRRGLDVVDVEIDVDLRRRISPWVPTFMSGACIQASSCEGQPNTAPKKARTAAASADPISRKETWPGVG